MTSDFFGEFNLLRWLAGSRQGPMSYRKSGISRIDAQRLERRVLYSATPVDGDLEQEFQEQLDFQECSGSRVAETFDASRQIATIDPQCHLELGVLAARVRGSGSDTLDVFDELIVVDRQIENAELLLHDLLEGRDSSVRTATAYLDTTDDLSAFSDILAQYSGLDGVHVLSHGSSQGIRLGKVDLNLETLDSYKHQIASWGDSFQESGDLLFYGCEVGLGAAGTNLLESIANLTEADAAGSSNLTGSSAGMDWELEVVVGEINAAQVLSQQVDSTWLGSLEVATFQQGVNGYIGTVDTHLDASAPTTDLSGLASLDANSSASEQQILLRFENLFGFGDGQIPLGATINSATLALTSIENAEVGSTVSVHPMLVAWDDNATFDSFTNGIATDGTEASASPVIQFPADGNVAPSGDVTSYIQSLSNGSQANLGWAIVSDGNSNFGVASSENVNESLRPMLTVDYSISSITVTTTLDTFDAPNPGTMTFADLATVAGKGADGFISLREAIVAANNSPGLNEILLPAGTYVRSNIAIDELGHRGDLDVVDDLMVRGEGKDASILSGTFLSRGMEVYGSRLLLEGISITGNTSIQSGGAIRIDAASDVTMRDVSISGNVATYGAGIYNQGTLLLEDVTLSGNDAVVDGGGIYNEGTAHLVRTVVRGNTAGGGGGIYNTGQLTGLDVAVNGLNYAADRGGGIHNDSGQVNLVNVTISGNRADSGGGGINNNGSSATFSLTNATISGNESLDDGGGIRTRQPIAITNSTIAYNTAVSDGGGLEGNDFILLNTILAENTAGSAGTDNASGNVISLGNNLDDDGSAGLSAAETIDPLTDPILLKPLADNGGFVETHALAYESPAIDAGTTTNAPATDAVGNVRTVVDIGAYEFTPLVITEAASAITIDGVADVLWSGVQPNDIQRVSVGTAAANFEASFQSLWDFNNLYLMITVSDDTPQSDSAEPWEDDAVEIYIDADHSRASSYDGVNDLHLYLGRDGSLATREAPIGFDTNVIDLVVDGDGVGYRVEVAIPWASLGVSPTSGDLIGLEVQVNDDEDGGVRESSIEWSDGADQSQSTPTAFGSATLEGVGVSPPTDISTGIEINADGGNNSFLQATDGGAIFGGLNRYTLETRFAVDAGSSTPLTVLANYHSDAGIGGDWLGVGISGGELLVLMAGQQLNLSGTLNGFDYDTLLDGDVHSLAITWDNAGGDLSVYADGVLVDADNMQAGLTLAGGGEFVIGQDQDSLGATFDPGQMFAGTVYDVRVWDQVRSADEIAFNYRHSFESGNLPAGLIANWQMDGFNGSGEVVDVVSGNNLIVNNTLEAGFTESVPSDRPTIAENSGNGTTVGFVNPFASEYQTVSSQLAGAFSYSLLDDSGGAFGIDSQSGRLIVVDGLLLDYETASTHTIVVQVANSIGQTYQESVDINVVDVNESPVVTTPVSLSVDQNASIPISFSIADEDAADTNDQLNLAVVSSPSTGTLLLGGTPVGGSSFTYADVVSGLLTFDHGGGATTSDSITFSIADGGEDGVGPVTFVVNLDVNISTNEPPRFSSLLPDISSNDAELINLDVSGYFNDPEGDPLSFAATGLPSGLSISPGGIISGTLDSSASQSGPYNVTVTVDDGNGGVASNEALFLSFAGDQSFGGTSIGRNAVSEFSGANLQLGSPTDGTPSILLEDQFDIGSFHYVTAATTVDLTTPLTLNAGDVLFSVRGSETNIPGLAIANSHEIIRAQPNSLGNFDLSNPLDLPTFELLLGVPSNQEINGLTLVESDTLIGDVTVNAGTFLFTDDSDPTKIHLLSVSSGAISSSELFDASAIGITANLNGLDLIEGDQKIGNTVLTEGTLLLSVENDVFNVGTSGSLTIVEDNDIVALQISQTEIGPSNSSSAEGTVIFDGPTVSGLASGVGGGIDSISSFDPSNSDTFVWTVGNPAPTLDTAISNRSNVDFDVVNFDVSVHFSDPDGDMLTFSAINLPNGLSINSAGLITGSIPASGGVSTVSSVEVMAHDGDGGTVLGAFDWTVGNQAPTLVTNGFGVLEGGVFQLTIGQLNASDLEQSAANLTYMVTTIPGVGHFGNDLGQIVASFTQQDILDQHIYYVHDGSESTSDSFTVQVSDGFSTSNPSSVSISIVTSNDVPLASAGTATVTEGGRTSISNLELSASDEESASSGLTWTITSQPQHGYVAVNSSGPTSSFTQAQIDAGLVEFVHNGGENLVDHLVLNVFDEHGGLVTNQRLDVTIIPTNDPPTLSTPSEPPLLANDLFLEFSTAMGNAIVLDDVDAGTQELELTLVATDGTLTLGASFGLTFITGDGLDDNMIVVRGSTNNLVSALDGLRFGPNSGFVGNATIALTLNDLGNTGGAPEQVTDSMTFQVAQRPDAVNDTYDETNTTSTGYSGNVLLNDISSSAITLISHTNPMGGSLELHSNGDFIFTPFPGFFGNASFTYVVANADGLTDQASVTITVAMPPPLPPVTGGGGSDRPIGEDNSSDSADSDDEASDTFIAGQFGSGTIVEEDRDSAKTRRASGSVSSVISPSQRVLPGSFNVESYDLKAYLPYWQRRFALTESSDEDSERSLFVVQEAFVLGEHFFEALDNASRQMLDSDRFRIRPIALVTTGSAVGWFLWSLRGGYLVASLLSTVSPWTWIDPLPILVDTERHKKSAKSEGSSNLAGDQLEMMTAGGP